MIFKVLSKKIDKDFGAPVMSKTGEWIEDLLGAARESGDTSLIACCGRGCASRKGNLQGMEQLHRAAAEVGCVTAADYAAFLKKALPLTIVDVDDGIDLHLNKVECSCPIHKELTQNTDRLCECTRGHEIAEWSAFFGQPVEIEIVESFLRGGSDCVTGIRYDK